MPQADLRGLPGTIKTLDQVVALVFIVVGQGRTLLEPVQGTAMRQDRRGPE